MRRLIRVSVLVCLSTVCLPAAAPAGWDVSGRYNHSPGGFASAATAPSLTALPHSRLPWLGRPWFLMGANLPCYPSGPNANFGGPYGVSQPAIRRAIAPIFRSAVEAGLHVIRWTTNTQYYGIVEDADGMPSGLNPAIYADYDAALQLAEQYDLYLVFLLFSEPGKTGRWWPDPNLFNDPAKRIAMVRALEPLFARYSANPHILAWEVFNEPEYIAPELHVLNGDAAIDTVRRIAAAVHAQSMAYVETGVANATAAGKWTSTGVDFVSPHWYDGSGGENNMLVMTAAQLQSQFAEEIPVGVGEWIGNAADATEPPVDPLKRWEHWYDAGYVGAWPWALIGRRLAVDFRAAAAFSHEHPDLGPHR